MEASGARGGSVRRPGARWLFCRKVLRFATNRETVRRIPMVQLMRSYIFHKSPQTKNYFYTKKRRLSIYKQTPDILRTPPPTTRAPHLIPPPAQPETLTSVASRVAPSRPALPSLVCLSPPSPHHLYCGVAAVAGAGMSALLILLHRGHHLLDGASAGGGVDAG
jgi:hypothetical protein